MCYSIVSLYGYVKHLSTAMLGFCLYSSTFPTAPLTNSDLGKTGIF